MSKAPTRWHLTLLMAQPAFSAIGWLGTVSKVSTNELAYRWIMANIPAGPKVANDTREVLLPDPGPELRVHRVPPIE